MFKLPKQVITDGKSYYKYELINWDTNYKQLLIKTRTPLEFTPEFIRINKTWYTIDKDYFNCNNTIICVDIPLYAIQYI